MATRDNFTEQSDPAERFAILACLHPYLVDDTYQMMKDHLSAIGPGSGRGRPCQMPAISSMTSRLILQFGMLYDELHGGKTQEDLTQFAEKLLSVRFGHEVPLLFTLVLKVRKQARMILSEEVDNTKLLHFLDQKQDFSYPRNTEYCRKFSVTKGFLLGASHSSAPPVFDCLPTGLLIELEHFRREQRLPASSLLVWLQELCPQLTSVVPTLTTKVRTLVKKHEKLIKDKTRYPEKLRQFKEDVFMPTPPVEAAQKSTVSQQRSGHAEQQGFMSTTPVEAAQTSTVLHQEGSCAEQQLDDQQKRVSSESNHTPDDQRCEGEQHAAVDGGADAGQRQEGQNFNAHYAVVQGLKETIAARNDQVTVLTVEVDELSKQLSKTSEELGNANNQLTSVKAACSELRKNSANVARARHALAAEKKRRADQQENVRTSDHCELLTKTRRLQSNVTVLQKKYQSAKQELHSANQTLKQVKRLNKEATEANEELVQRLQEQQQEQQRPMYKTKEDGKYTDGVQLCAAQLVGELDVAASRVSKIIQCVAHHVFDTEIPAEDLPSKTTVFRYVDTSHALAKLHVGEELQQHAFDLHTDGTSRDRKKYVGQQVTLSNKKSLSCGFHLVSRETAETLTDKTMELITEVASMSAADDDELDTTVKNILRNLGGTMSDRASVMKKFNQDLSDTRNRILGTDSGLEFLYCNAHFLLGLSNAAEKAFATLEESEGIRGNLGRDALPAFAHFKASATEPSALRALRTTCDVLGPRGDEKNGCRDYWLGFCQLQELTSKISSFRSNRFNNTFEGAAAIIHHLDDIRSFLDEHGEEKPNLKLQSVLADLTNDKVVTMLAALAIAFVCITGPFWVMINCDVHYLDLYRPIQSMKTSIQNVIDHPEEIDTLITTLPSALDTFILEETTVTESIAHFARSEAYDTDLLKKALLQLCESFLTVIDNQLKDFLVGGRYSTHPTEEARQKMAHCRTTNLLGEACLGDLDFSINKRRNASVFYHTTISMLKRNKPISSWLTEKTEAEQKNILQTARRKGASLRSVHRERERAVVAEDKARVVARAEDKEDKERTERQRRFNIITDVASGPLRGPCLSPADVDKLVSAYPTQTSKKNALHLHLRYYRIVMNSKGPLLQIVRKDLNNLMIDFKTFLMEFYPQGPPVRVPVDNNLQDEDCIVDPLQPKSKRRRLHQRVDDPDTSSSSEEDSESSNYSQEDQEESDRSQGDEEEGAEDLDFDGKFSTQGQRVAVYYDEQYFIGEVLQVKDEETATLSFMKQDGIRNSFGWPASIDLDTIFARFVFDWNIQMDPCGQRARRWSATNFAALQSRYQLFKSTYC